ncbi:MAG: hypothetical protein J5U19_06140 [Candidatus Methanoperedens sp.]|nr:hypothetical protein [Candidatus Methanoperedens sp.]
MSEDSSSNRYQKKEEERNVVLDFSGSLGNSSGLTPLNYDSEPPMNVNKRRNSPQRTLRTQSPGLTNFAYKWGVN